MLQVQHKMFYAHREGATNQTGSVGEHSKSFSWMIYELHIGKLLGICQAERKGRKRQDEIIENSCKEHKP